MRHFTSLLLTIACLAGANLMAADSPFVGKWKIDPDKSKGAGLQEKIEDLGNNQFKFIFGDDAETMIFDGKEHPTPYGSVRIITADGPDHWTSVAKRDGKVTSTHEWTISDGGKKFTIKSEEFRPDGTTLKDEFEAKRIAGTSGLAGTWENTKVDMSNYPEWVIEPFENDGLVFMFPAYKETDHVKFDGKDYSPEGPRVAPGATMAGKRIDEHTLEITYKLKGKVTETDRMEMSGDGKTLSVTLAYPGVEKTELHVYTRE